MNMTKNVVFIGTCLLMLLVICGTILVLMGRDPVQIFSFAATAIIPTASILYFGQKVEKTQDAAETVVAQTNGRMTELIENNRLLTDKVAALSGAMPPETFEETFSDWGDERAPDNVDEETEHPTNQMFA